MEAIAQLKGPEGLGLELLKQMQTDILEHCLRLHREFGEAVRYRVVNFEIYQFTHPELMHEVLGPKNRAFIKPARMREVLGQWNGKGLILNEGEPWARQRRLIGPAFRQQRLDAYIAGFERQAKALVEGWAGQARVEVSKDLMRMTLRAVAEALFGAEVEAHEERLVEAVNTLNEAAIQEMTAPFVLPLWFPSPAKRRTRAAITAIISVVDGFIKARRAEPGGEDLLSRMLLAVDEEGDRTGMSDQQARDESVNLMLGGNETTATALSWTLHLLSLHPELQEEAAAEARTLEGKVTASALEGLSLIRGCFMEAMRLYPPAYVLTREVAEPVEVGGHALRPGAQVHLVPFITHRDPRWFEEPEVFDPRRFAREEELPRCAYLPFGAGPRACIGRGFAMIEAVLALARILSAYRLRPVPGREVELEAQVSLHPKGGLELLTEPR